jgi:arylsulfatase A
MRKQFLFFAEITVGLLVVVTGCRTQSRVQDTKQVERPNIVYILTDDLGCGDVDALNPLGKIKTPHLRQFAMEGMTFTEAHSSSSVSTPSRYNILTGRYSWRSRLKSGVLGGFSRPLIEEGRLTMGQMLHDQGYQTAYIGKWHLGMDWARKSGTAMETDLGEDELASTNRNPNAARGVDFSKPIGRTPLTLGFDEFFGVSASLDMPPYVYIENDQVTAEPTITNGFLIGRNGKRTRVGPQAPGFNAEDVLPTFTKRAVEYINQAAAATKTGKPFFLYVALPAPHTPISPSVEWLGKSGLNFYADYVMETDASVGELLDALKRNGLAKNTLVVFTSDNGCSPEADLPFLISHGHDSSDGRRGYKGDIFDGGHRVPLIVRWPARVPRDSRNNDLVCLGDFMATCADLLDVKLPDNAAEDSISFLPPLLGKGPGGRDTLVESSDNGSFAIRHGQWKLAFCPDSDGWSYPRPGRDKTNGLPRFQLFALAADPAEKTNVLADHPDVVQQLGHRMRDIIFNGRSTPGEAQPNAPTEEWLQTAWLEEFK